MHPIQKKLMELAQIHDLSTLGLRQITRMVGETHPQKVKHHMQRLKLLDPTPNSKADADNSRLVPIPLVGMANCGEATIYAESYDDQLIQVSQKIIPQKFDNLFAVQAVGNSMNKSTINGNNIEDGDYIIVNPDDKDFNDGDYVLSIINGMANVKKFIKDTANQQIILTSESTENHHPIYIHEDDLTEEEGVDAKLIRLAKIMDARLYTTDFNLDRIASLQGIDVLNVNTLIEATHIVIVAGEELSVKLVKEGRESNQAIGYMPDGTMVVVSEARHLIGEKINVMVTSVLQTQAGKMIFGKLS